MDTILKFIRRTGLILLILMSALPVSHLSAMTQIVPDAKVEGKPQHITELIGTFDRAQEAIRAQDLDALMTLYAPDYHYHGLTKDNIRQIWAELFLNYNFIANIHTFSAIKFVGPAKHPTAEITCTGSLWATSVNTKERIPIDSWHQEVHRLVREDDGWHIIGHLGGAPAVRHFGTAPHPLF